MFKFKRVRNEEYHIDMFAKEMKEAWKSSRTDIEGFVWARKYLKKAKLDKVNHPYLYAFRERIDEINIYSIEGKIEMDLALKDFFEKRREIYIKNQ